MNLLTDCCSSSSVCFWPRTDCLSSISAATKATSVATKAFNLKKNQKNQVQKLLEGGYLLPFDLSFGISTSIFCYYLNFYSSTYFIFSNIYSFSYSINI